MCPMCIATLALVAAGATSTGGAAALVKRLVVRARDRARSESQAPPFEAVEVKDPTANVR
jgi:hypothetical protein